MIMPDEPFGHRITSGGLRTGSNPTRAALSAPRTPLPSWTTCERTSLISRTEAEDLQGSEGQHPHLAYVAQDAFHHIEKHMQETPTLYFMWRFVGNDDKVSIEFKSDEEAEGLQGSEG